MKPATGMAIGVAVVAVTLTLALHVVAPMVRHALGAPADFNQDYTSPEAEWQALSIQAACLSMAFLAVGLRIVPSRQRGRLPWAFVLANPLVLGAGYGIYQLFVPDSVAWEYWGVRGWAFKAVIGPLPLAAALQCGLWLRSHRPH